jgi:hypothetical protein
MRNEDDMIQHQNKYFVRQGEPPRSLPDPNSEETSAE